MLYVKKYFFGMEEKNEYNVLNFFFVGVLCGERK